MKSYHQQKDYTCGCAVVRTLLGAYGMKVPSEAELERVLRTTDARGTAPRSIDHYLRKLGFEVEWHETDRRRALWNEPNKGHTSDLIAGLKKGRFALIDWADWGGHWALAVEYRRVKGWSGGQLKLADPAARFEGRPDGFTYVSADRLASMWFSPIGGERGLYLSVWR